MSPMHYLLLGYGLIWLGLGVYLFRLNGRLERVHRDVFYAPRQRSGKPL